MSIIAGKILTNPGASRCPPQTRRRRAVTTGTAVALALLALAGGATGNRLAAQTNPPANEAQAKRDTYEKTLERIDEGKLTLVDQLKAQAGQYWQLLPFVEYRMLLRQFDDASDDSIDAFVDRHPNAVVSELIRTRHLQRLAKRKRWVQFQQRIDALAPSRRTRELRCLTLRADLETGAEMASLRDDLVAIWSTARSLPDACDPVFARWQQSGLLDQATVLQRVRLAVQAGNTKLARFIGRNYPSNGLSERVDAWITARRDPLRVLQQLPRNLAAGDDNALQMRDYAIQRDAWMSGTDAPERLSKWLKQFQIAPEEAHVLTRKLAVRAAVAGKTYASQLLDRITNAFHDDESREWHIVASLRDGRHGYAAILIDALPAPLADKSRWQYWGARLAADKGDLQKANPVFQALAKTRDYYGFLAADQLDQAYSLADRPATLAPGAAGEDNPTLAYAHALFAVDDLHLARLQWAFATRTLSRDELVSAALAAHQWGWHDRAIFTMAKAEYWDDVAVRFPLVHQPTVTRLARESGLNPAWVYGVIRQESAFVSDARSEVGALGLMQLMPATAKRVARQANLKWRGQRTLLELDSNIRLGSTYLNELYVQCGGHAALATASYNAGPKRVQRWLPKTEPMDGQLWIEAIPYAETRQFTKNVFAFTAVYEKRLGRKTRRISAKLKAVPTKAC